MGLVCFSFPAHGQLDERSVRCLFSSSGGVAPSLERCGRDDKLSVASLPGVQVAISRLGLEDVQVTFVGCADVNFATQERPHPIDPVSEYFVFYPTDMARDELLIPIQHELGHVYQMETTGGYRALMATANGAKIELGADYIAGLLNHEIRNSPLAHRFVENSSLVGDFVGSEHASHGCPGNRSDAFIAGTIAPLDARYDDIRVAYQDYIDREHKVQTSNYACIREVGNLLGASDLNQQTAEFLPSMDILNDTGVVLELAQVLDATKRCEQIAQPDGRPRIHLRSDRLPKGHTHPRAANLPIW